MLYKILNSAKFVVSNSKHVKVNYEKINEIIDNGDFDNIGCWLNSNPFGLMEMNVKDIINFLLIYHTVGDFCFWGEPKWEVSTDIGVLDGSFAIMYLLLDRYKNNGNFDMSLLTFSTILDGNVEIPLLNERYNFLVQMNNYLKKINGDFYDQVKNINSDKELFDYILDNFAYFKDESIYENEEVYFYKRAQLLVSDILHVRELKENIKVDYSNLLGCADYKIPQVLNSYGILEYSNELDRLLDSKTEIEKDSIYENEIRASVLVVINYIYEKLGKKVSRMDINDYIWGLGQDKSKMTKLYHRTRTVCY
ncbi:MAG: hypothetical protein IJ475_03695 [Bacilli bacterium]|nr:hypothetical protein [Bacilli bacterium]